MKLIERRGRLTLREREVVGELVRVMQGSSGKPAIKPVDLAQLIDIAFEVSLTGQGAPTREEKLARAYVRGLEARQRLAEAEGGSWSSEEVAGLLSISKTAVLKRLAAGRLLAWREERLKAARFPKWQFSEHGQALPGLEEILEILNADERLDAWGKILFFVQERPGLEHQRPLDLLRKGKWKEVKLTAQAYVE